MATQVKICGIKSEEALDAALEAGADFVGLVFYPHSPRAIGLAEGEALSAHAHARGRARVVALLVDPDDTLLSDVVRHVHPDMIQLHGLETEDRVAEIRERTGLPVMKAISVREPSDVAAAAGYHAPGRRADIVLFDAKPPPDPAALPGGNGLSFDWRILDAVQGRFPFALAGGLTEANVAAAIRLTGAAIVDVSSGVERAPGEKDPDLIRRFLRAAKGEKNHARL